MSGGGDESLTHQAATEEVHREDLKDPPLFRGEPIIGSARRFKGNAPDLYLRVFGQYPNEDVVRIHLGRHRYVYVTRSPECVERVLQHNTGNYSKAGYSLLEPLIGNGLLRNEGPTYSQQKKLMHPPMHGYSLKGLVPGMVAVVHAMIESWRERIRKGEQVFEIESEVTRLTLGMVTSTLLGKDMSELGDDVGESLRFVLRYGINRTGDFLPVPYGIPTPNNRRYKEALDDLDDVVYSLIQEKRAAGRDPGSVGHGDLLSRLVAARDEETNAAMTDEQLRDETMTLLTAGHETTAKALCWSLYLLQKHPEVRDELRAESLELLGEADPTAEVVSGPRDVNGTLQRTRRVFEETMRLYPPVVHLARKVHSEDWLGDYRIRSGSRVILSQFATHRNPRIWESPEKFDPDRFKTENISQMPKFCYFPFGGGARSCIGRAFAYMEVQIALSMIIRSFNFKLCPDQRVDTESLFTLRPKYGLTMTVSEV